MKPFQKTQNPATFNIMLRRANGESEPLVKSLASAEQALYIEQEIERFLALDDVAVPRELSRV